ncbi:MAG: metallophosphoesterase family protein [Anaerolineales bacterium]|nr:metallophosphoesterase family protein [Anaerolineales bacterium]MCB8953901.1 metallophosphoesterase family protein [Ardenticatenales bacterium]
MRLLIISDIHANLTALEAVLTDAQGAWDQVWCLGDVVGYGPDPNECVTLLQSLPHISLSGNHDWAVLDRLDINTFNPEARQAIGWTQDQLTPESRAYLEELPSLIFIEPIFTLAHASPRQPVWEYILDAATAAVNFNHFETSNCLVGHTHVPIIYALRDDRVTTRAPLYGQPFTLNESERLIINPGSVGQPRDADPRAAYALLDLERMTWEHRRVGYDIDATQERMRRHNLPQRLITRLAYGW